VPAGEPATIARRVGSASAERIVERGRLLVKHLLKCSARPEGVKRAARRRHRRLHGRRVGNRVRMPCASDTLVFSLTARDPPW